MVLEMYCPKLFDAVNCVNGNGQLHESRAFKKFSLVGYGRVVKASDSGHLMGILILTRAQVQVAATTVHYVV